MLLSILFLWMSGQRLCEYNQCFGELTCRVDDFDFSKQVYFKYQNEDGIKRDLVAHFYIENGAFVFIVAFSSDY